FVSDGFFRTLGVAPVMGRDFLLSEEEASAERVVILSYGAWQSRFGGNGLDGIRRPAPPSRYSADRSRVVGHVVGWRRLCDELVIEKACLEAALQRRMKQKFGSHGLHGASSAGDTLW